MEEVKKLSKVEIPQVEEKPKPYWFGELLAQGFSEK